MQIIIDDIGESQRIDQYLVAKLPELSRARIQSLIKSGDILLNGKACKAKNSVYRGSSISIDIPEPETAEAQPQDIPIHVLYEDADMLIIDKESGLVVHPAAGNPDGTLVNAEIGRASCRERV